MVNATGGGIGQSRNLLLDLRGREISSEEVRRGVVRTTGRYADRLESLRVDFDGPDGPTTIIWERGG
jgi:hypothetical protein